MYTYEEFKEKFVNEFMTHMGPDYDSYELNVRKILKVNRELDAVNVLDPNATEQIVPTIYIQDFYEDYQKCEDFDKCIDLASDILKKHAKGNDIVKKIDFSKAKDKVVFQLINTRNNESLLAEVPHRDFMDLSVIYRLAISVDSNGISSVVIHNELMEAMGVNEEELFELAINNTRLILPLNVSGMRELLISMAEKYSTDESEYDAINDRMNHMDAFYVLGNKYGFIGANALLYDDVLQELSDKCGSDLYILPSSVNEVIAIASSSDISPETLLDMVIGINASDVDPSEQLSNSVYYYSASEHSIVPVAIECVN